MIRILFIVRKLGAVESAKAENFADWHSAHLAVDAWRAISPNHSVHL